MDIFVAGFWILTVVCIVLFYLTHTSKGAAATSSGSTGDSFRAFQRLYLVVYLLAMGTSCSFLAMHLVFHFLKNCVQVPYYVSCGFLNLL